MSLPHQRLREWCHLCRFECDNFHFHFLDFHVQCVSCTRPFLGRDSDQVLHEHYQMYPDHNIPYVCRRCHRVHESHADGVLTHLCDGMKPQRAHQASLPLDNHGYVSTVYDVAVEDEYEEGAEECDDDHFEEEYEEEDEDLEDGEEHQESDEDRWSSEGEERPGPVQEATHPPRLCSMCRAPCDKLGWHRDWQTCWCVFPGCSVTFKGHERYVAMVDHHKASPEHNIPFECLKCGEKHRNYFSFFAAHMQEYMDEPRELSPAPATSHLPTPAASPMTGGSTVRGSAPPSNTLPTAATTLPVITRPKDHMWVSHRAKRSRGAFECYLCHKLFRNRVALKDHVTSPKHGFPETFLRDCPHPTCGQQFPTLQALWEHIEDGSCGIRRFQAKDRALDGRLEKRNRKKSMGNVVKKGNGGAGKSQKRLTSFGTGRSFWDEFDFDAMDDFGYDYDGLVPNKFMYID